MSDLNDFIKKDSEERFSFFLDGILLTITSKNKVSYEETLEVIMAASKQLFDARDNDKHEKL